MAALALSIPAFVCVGFFGFFFFFLSVNKSDKVLPGWATSATASFYLLTTMTSPTEDISTGSLVHCFSLLCVLFVRLKMSSALSALLHTYLKTFQFLLAVIKQEVTGRDELPFGSGFPAIMSVRSQNAS